MNYRIFQNSVNFFLKEGASFTCCGEVSGTINGCGLCTGYDVVYNVQKYQENPDPAWTTMKQFQSKQNALDYILFLELKDGKTLG